MAEPKVRFKQEGGTSFPAWETVPMSEVFTEISEKNHPEMPVLSVQQGVGTVLRDSSDRNIIYDKSNLKNYKVMKKNDFIIHLRSFEGGLEYSNYDGISSPAYRILRPKAILPATFRDYFRSYDFIHNKLSVAVVGIRDGKNIDMDTFWQIPISVPCLEEQQKIANFLSSVDVVISTSEQEVANLETQKKAVMKKIFSQKVRFKRADGSDFPEWEEKKLGDVCSKIGSGKTPKGGSEVYTQNGVLFIRSQNVTNAMLNLADRTCIPKSVHEGMRNTELQYLDVLLNITGASIGRCCLFDLHEVANVNQHVCIIRLKDKQSYVPKYVEQIMLSDYIQNQIWSCQNGGSREGLNFEQIGNFSFLSPCFEEQRLIADFLSNFDEAIAAAKKELELWKELKKGLLQKMFV